jgi:hypothetical protein
LRERGFLLELRLVQVRLLQLEFVLQNGDLLVGFELRPGGVDARLVADLLGLLENPGMLLLTQRLRYLWNLLPLITTLSLRWSRIF